MNGRSFIDTNLLIYLVSNVPDKKQRVEEILANDRAVISTQVVNEFISVCLKKSLLPIKDIRYAVDVFSRHLVSPSSSKLPSNAPYNFIRHYSSPTGMH